MRNDSILNRGVLTPEKEAEIHLILAAQLLPILPKAQVYTVIKTYFRDYKELFYEIKKNS